MEGKSVHLNRGGLIGGINSRSNNEQKTWLQELAKREPNMFAHWALGWKP